MMHERAKVGGGTFAVKSLPNEGTTISVRYPSALREQWRRNDEK
jgi:signal transduction histidine kinase